MDLGSLDGNANRFRTYESAKIEVANKTIVIFVMLVRQFVFGIGLDVMAFWRLEFFDDMFNRMHRLEHDREKHGRDGEKIVYSEF